MAFCALALSDIGPVDVPFHVTKCSRCCSALGWVEAGCRLLKAWMKGGLGGSTRVSGGTANPDFLRGASVCFR